MSRFETEVVTIPDNLQSLMTMPGRWVDQFRQRRPFNKLILDMDSSMSETYGHQEGSAFNGYFGCTCYHPLFVFNQDGDVEVALLRHGNAHSADDWRLVPEPVIARYVTFQLAQVTASSDLLRLILNRIRRLGVPPPLAVTG